MISVKGMLVNISKLCYSVSNHFHVWMLEIGKHPWLPVCNLTHQETSNMRNWYKLSFNPCMVEPETFFPWAVIFLHPGFLVSVDWARQAVDGLVSPGYRRVQASPAWPCLPPEWSMACLSPVRSCLSISRARSFAAKSSSGGSPSVEWSIGRAEESACIITKLNVWVWGSGQASCHVAH